MEDLHQSAALKPNEVIQNLREDSQHLFVLFYCQHSLAISGDVIEIVPARK
ncbi:MAG TPA: hypothetical protein VF875_06345 [Anaeromyxobacter sp.]